MILDKEIIEKLLNVDDIMVQLESPATKHERCHSSEESPYRKEGLLRRI